MTRDYLYVIGRDEGPVKVGIATAPLKRLTTIRTSCPFKIEILHIQPMRDRDHARKHERLFHRCMDERRLAGEWFSMTADEAIEEIETGLDIELFHEARDVDARAAVSYPNGVN